ncbi:MAG: flagellar hook-length control protein FliK [Acetobacteraceae bacterium]|nr:flagellar hook-length control protein FliK [Acetobacteraceae bacterium]
MLQAISADPTRASVVEDKAAPAADKAAAHSNHERKSAAANSRKRPDVDRDKSHLAANRTGTPPSNQPPAVLPNPPPPVTDETPAQTPLVAAEAQPAGFAQGANQATHATTTTERHAPQSKEPTAVAPADPLGKSVSPQDAATPLLQPTPAADAHITGAGATASAGSPTIQAIDPTHAAAAAPTQLSPETRESQAPAPSTPAPPPAAATPPSQLQQVPPAAVVAHSSGPQHLTIRLTPPELGSLQVRIDQSVGAPPRIEIKVEHAQTLDLLLHDQPRLHQALDQAGIPADGRHITLSLDDAGQNSSGGSQRRASGSDRNDQNNSADRGPEPGQSTGPVQAQTTWRQGGLDITA